MSQNSALFAARRRLLLALPVALLAAACAPLTPSTPSTPTGTRYVVLGDQGQALARVVTPQDHCPTLRVDGQPLAMQLRAAPSQVPARAKSAQPESKPADFPVRICEAALPAGAHQASVDGQALPLPPAQVRRIAILGDTGCRLKASDHAFQNCNDAKDWPFAQVAASAAAWKPELVIHVGDYQYRESPCPATRPGCAGSSWGFGWDTWNDDLFVPAAPLLAAAPWVVVRGNHEMCKRAGQGWFRLLAPEPWTPERSCDDASRDARTDHTPPYAVPLDADTQLIVFDSSAVPYKAQKPDAPAYQQYLSEAALVKALALQKPKSIFLSHHPVTGFYQTENPAEAGLGSVVLQAVFGELNPARYFPAGVQLALHGHVHLFESIDFVGDHPTTFVLGNSGSATEGALPDQLAPGDVPAPGTQVAQYDTLNQFGFATLERDGAGWLLIERDVAGKPVRRCALRGEHSDCGPASSAP